MRIGDLLDSLASERQQIMRDYMAKIGRRGGKASGQVKSEAKAEAARRNGRKGGRPRKQKKGD